MAAYCNWEWSENDHRFSCDLPPNHPGPNHFDSDANQGLIDPDLPEPEAPLTAETDPEIHTDHTDWVEEE